MARIILLLLSFLAGITFPGQRGLWIVRNSLSTGQDLKFLQMVNQNIGLTDIYFQVRALGKNIIAREKDGQQLSLNEILQFCRQNNIRFHAWINAFYIWTLDEVPKDSGHSILWDKDHLMTDASENIQKPAELKKIGIEGYFVDPEANVNMQQLKQLIKELVLHYGVQGIHLDYFRYPSFPVHYSRFLRAKFLHSYFLDPARMQVKQAEYFAVFGNNGARLMSARYQLFLQNELIERLNDLTNFTKNLADSIQVSVAVKPNIGKARRLYAQDWPKWLADDACDYIVMMNYTPDQTEFKKNLNVAKSIKQDARIVVGIGAYYLDRAQIGNRIREVEQMGFNGYCLFSFTTLKTNPDLVLKSSVNSFSGNYWKR